MVIDELLKLMLKKGISVKREKIENLDILPRQRTDQIEVNWK